MSFPIERIPGLCRFRPALSRLVRRLPLLRRPFVQRDALARQLEEAQAGLARLRAAGAPDPEWRSPGFVAALSAAVQPMRMFVSRREDAPQDREIGDFRHYIRRSVEKDWNLLEIGPSFSPILPKREGYATCVLDHLDRPGLLAKYAGGGLDLDAIEEVDVVWRGGPLSSGFAEQRFAAIVASHVVEHAPDFVSFLAECAALLEPGGRVFLIVPDRRYCFDLLKPASDLGKIVEDHARRRARHSLESHYRTADDVLTLPATGGGLAWGVLAPPQGLQVRFPDFFAMTRIAEANGTAEGYSDAHGNFFTPSAFARLCLETRLLGLQPLRPTLVTRARGCEFLIVLEHGGRVRAAEQQAFPAARALLLFDQLQEEREKLQILEPALRAMDH